jgi:hypothetical protein
MREEQGGPPPHQAPPQRSQLKQQALAAAVSSPAVAAAAPADSAAKEAEERKRAASEGLPEGWAVAFDGNQRPYFWHKVTKVRWLLPREVWAGGAAAGLAVAGRGRLRIHPSCAV